MCVGGRLVAVRVLAAALAHLSDLADRLGLEQCLRIPSSHTQLLLSGLGQHGVDRSSPRC